MRKIFYAINNIAVYAGVVSAIAGFHSQIEKLATQELVPTQAGAHVSQVAGHSWGVWLYRM